MSFTIHLQTDFRFEILNNNNEVVAQPSSAPISHHTWFYVTCPTHSEDEHRISPTGSIETFGWIDDEGWIVDDGWNPQPTSSNRPSVPIDESWDMPPTEDPSVELSNVGEWDLPTLFTYEEEEKTEEETEEESEEVTEEETEEETEETEERKYF